MTARIPISKCPRLTTSRSTWRGVGTEHFYTFYRRPHRRSSPSAEILLPSRGIAFPSPRHATFSSVTQIVYSSRPPGNGTFLFSHFLFISRIHSFIDFFSPLKATGNGRPLTLQSLWSYHSFIISFFLSRIVRRLLYRSLAADVPLHWLLAVVLQRIDTADGVLNVDRPRHNCATVRIVGCFI